MDFKHNKNLVPFAKRLRREMTKEERRLGYNFLARHPVRFYRQRIIGPDIVDFYCHSAKLVIELDGSQHYQPEETQKDNKRSEYLQSLGLQVIRFSNLDVLQNFEGVCMEIERFLYDRCE